MTTEAGSTQLNHTGRGMKKAEHALSSIMEEDSSYSLERWKAERQGRDEPWKPIWTFQNGDRNRNRADDVSSQLESILSVLGG